MRGWLIDTNVVSELRRARPAQKVRAFVAAQPGDVLFTSHVTFAEVRFGIEQIADPARRSDLVHWLDRTLRPLFAGRVLPVTEDALLRWRLMLEAGRKTGHTFPEPDLLIAALAAIAELIVVSRDTSAFIAAGVAETGATGPWIGFNVMLAAGMIREAAAMVTQVGGEVIPSNKPGTLALAMAKPKGVCLGIAPWNAPVILGTRAVAMPLACGNTVVLKSSELCPALHRLIGECFAEAGLPDGVLNVVSNAPEDAATVVEALIRAPE